MTENRGREGSYRPQGPTGWRTKGGLETPLRGRIYGENKRLVFAPPSWYDALVVGCLVAGVLCFLASVGFVGGLPLDRDAFGPVLQILAIGLCISGVWAALSNERIACDLRARTYARLEGQGIGKRVSRGSLDELYGIVLMSEVAQFAAFTADKSVTYRLVLYWKGSKEPLLVVEPQYHLSLRANDPINARAGQIAAMGQRYAQALGIPFYDYSHTHSPGPLPVA